MFVWDEENLGLRAITIHKQRPSYNQKLALPLLAGKRDEKHDGMQLQLAIDQPADTVINGAWESQGHLLGVSMITLEIRLE